MNILQGGCDKVVARLWQGCDKVARTSHPCHHLVIPVWAIKSFTLQKNNNTFNNKVKNDVAAVIRV